MITEGTARLIVIKNGKEMWNKYTIRKGTLDSIMLDAEDWVYNKGAEYARIDIWDERINDWAVYCEYERS